MWVQVQHDVFSNDLPQPVLPRRAVFPSGSAPLPPSKVPNLDGQKLDGLDPLQRQRLQNDRDLAQSQEKELHEVCHPSQQILMHELVVSSS
jgi:hypothetical protein